MQAPGKTIDAGGNLSVLRADVQVWSASVGNWQPHLASLAALLAPEEAERSRRFLLQRDRDRSVTSRGLLRLILATYLRTEPAQIQFRYLAQGKPVLAPELHPGPLHFSVSHSRDLIVYAISFLAPLGVDVELVRPLPESARVSADYYSGRENQILAALDPTEQTEAFFRVWTRKEAYLKAIGIGLGQALREIEVSVLRDEPARILSVAGDEREAARWHLAAFQPDAGYLAALATTGPIGPISVQPCLASALLPESRL
jgi:4'-phosphopantetheinyl transferase